MALGCVASVFQLRTDERSTLKPPSSIDLIDFHGWSNAVLNPLEVFGKAFASKQLGELIGAEAAYVVLVLALLGVTLSLLKTPFVFLIWASAYLAMGAFSTLIYPAALRHQGVLYISLIAALWMASSGWRIEFSNRWSGMLWRTLHRVRLVALPSCSPSTGGSGPRGLSVMASVGALVSSTRARCSENFERQRSTSAG
jgi:hypothetical protein